MVPIEYKFSTSIKRLCSINYGLPTTPRSIPMMKNIMPDAIKALERNSFGRYMAGLVIKAANVYSG
jgi:hypothetical protein